MYNGVYTKEQYAYMHDTLMKWMDIKIHGGSIGDILNDKGVEHIAIYGINDLGRMVYEDVKSSLKVRGFVDRKAVNSDLQIDGIKVIAPSEVLKLLDKCYILVTPEYYFREISEDLVKYGIGEERIISLGMAVS